MSNIAEIAHINGLNKDSMRYNTDIEPSMLNEQSNLMVLCPSCHTNTSHIYSKTEYNAHKKGIEILVSLYAKKAPELNYVEFMELFRVPNRMEDAVVSEMKNYYF